MGSRRVFRLASCAANAMLLALALHAGAAWSQTAWRPDKPVEEIETVQTLREMMEREERGS